MVTRIMIMAGGTGGHVFPALAVAEQLRASGVEVVWMGTRTGLEAEVVPRSGIAMEWVKVSGLRGKGALNWVLAPFRLLLALIQSLIIIMRCRPMAVLGMGGFVAGPGGLVTWLLRKPLLIHEQNAIAGMTNRLLSHCSTVAMEAFPGALSGHGKAVLTGNPIRSAIAALPAPETRFSDRSGRLRLLVLGGSLGAQALNEVVPKAIEGLPEGVRPEVWHQAGSRNIDTALQHYKEAKIGTAARTVAFIDDMAAAYAWADLVLCRAGALTIAELAAAGVGAILVPYPHAVDDHQTRNAAYLVDQGAALLLPQPQLTPKYLGDLLQDFCTSLSDSAGTTVMKGRDRLLAMAQAARQLARPDAAQQIANLCMEAAHA